MASASDEDCGYADLELEAGVAADLAELGSEAGYSDCSEVLRPADVMAVASGDESPAEAAASATPTEAVATINIEDSPLPAAARFQEPGAAQFEASTDHKYFRMRRKTSTAVQHAGNEYSAVEREWIRDMQRWSSYLRTPMDEQRLQLGEQAQRINLLCPFAGNLSELFEAMVRG